MNPVHLKHSFSLHFSHLAFALLLILSAMALPLKVCAQVIGTGNKIVFSAPTDAQQAWADNSKTRNYEFKIPETADADQQHFTLTGLFPINSGSISAISGQYAINCKFRKGNSDFIGFAITRQGPGLVKIHLNLPGEPPSARTAGCILPDSIFGKSGCDTCMRRMTIIAKNEEVLLYSSSALAATLRFSSDSDYNDVIRTVSPVLSNSTASYRNLVLYEGSLSARAMIEQKLLDPLGKPGTALFLDGKTYIDLGTVPTGSLPPAFSVSLRAHRHDWQKVPPCTIISNRQKDGFSLSITDSLLKAEISGNSQNLSCSVPLRRIKSGWRQFFLTFNGYNLRLYVDGVVASEAKSVKQITIPHAADRPVMIGAAPGPAGKPKSGPWFYGTTDEAGFYKCALSPSKVMAEFLGMLSVSSACLAAGFDFNENGETVVSDMVASAKGKVFSGGASSAWVPSNLPMCQANVQISSAGKLQHRFGFSIVPKETQAINFAASVSDALPASAYLGRLPAAAGLSEDRVWFTVREPGPHTVAEMSFILRNAPEYDDIKRPQRLVLFFREAGVPDNDWEALGVAYSVSADTRTVRFKDVPFRSGQWLIGRTSPLKTMLHNVKEICSGSKINVFYHCTEMPLSGNRFTLEISDNEGSFGNPHVLAAVDGISSEGSVPVIIPKRYPPGSAYRIRIRSSYPALTGSPSDNFEILGAVPGHYKPAAFLQSNSPVLLNEPIRLSAPLFPGADYWWTGPAGFSDNTAAPAPFTALEQASGRYSLIISQDACRDTFYTDVAVIKSHSAKTPAGLKPARPLGILEDTYGQSSIDIDLHPSENFSALEVFSEKMADINTHIRHAERVHDEQALKLHHSAAVNLSIAQRRFDTAVIHLRQLAALETKQSVKVGICSKMASAWQRLQQDDSAANSYAMAGDAAEQSGNKKEAINHYTRAANMISGTDDERATIYRSIAERLSSVKAVPARTKAEQRLIAKTEKLRKARYKRDTEIALQLSLLNRNKTDRQAEAIKAEPKIVAIEHEPDPFGRNYLMPAEPEAPVTKPKSPGSPVYKMPKSTGPDSSPLPGKTGVPEGKTNLPKIVKPNSKAPVKPVMVPPAKKHVKKIRYNSYSDKETGHKLKPGFTLAQYHDSNKPDFKPDTDIRTGSANVRPDSSNINNNTYTEDGDTITGRPSREEEGAAIPPKSRNNYRYLMYILGALIIGVLAWVIIAKIREQEED
ncbi:MAG: LamG-like jellyroll fold domain-containing protein [Bacteroidota bacterium]